MAAYLISLCKITNPHDNFKKYIKISEDMLKQHGGSYVVRGQADSAYCHVSTGSPSCTNRIVIWDCGTGVGVAVAGTT